MVKWSEKLDQVKEFSDGEDDIVELTPEKGDTGGRGALTGDALGPQSSLFRFEKKIGVEHI